MKITGSGTAKPRLSLHTIMFRVTAGLFVLTMLSVFLVCGMFAKYVVSGGIDDSARVQGGIGIIEVWEHEAAETGENSGMYSLNEKKEVIANTYGKVLPGVDIPKDPFIRLTNLTSAACELYVSIGKSKDFPNTVSYAVDDTLWEHIGNEVYRYIGSLDPTQDQEIHILKDDTLEVSQYYVGNGKFSLNFIAWIEQKPET